jgi:hypothetical protein
MQGRTSYVAYFFCVLARAARRCLKYSSRCLISSGSVAPYISLDLSFVSNVYRNHSSRASVCSSRSKTASARCAAMKVTPSRSPNTTVARHSR